MKVKDLIALLQTMPQDLPVTSYNGQEDTAELTKKGVKLYDKAESRYFRASDGKEVKNAHVDIMGY